MSTLKDVFDKKKGEGVPLLKGSDLDKKESSVTIKVKDFREAPDNFSGIAIIDFEGEIHGKAAWSVNKTNMRALMEKFGIEDDAEFSFIANKLRGKKLTLSKVMVNNPQTKKVGPSLFIS
jgi:hypothetical protein